MRLRPFRGIRFLSTTLIASTLAIASTSAEAQSSTKVEDGASRAVALAARIGAARVGAVARSTRDVVRLSAGDSASLAEATSTPYRSTPAPDGASGGFAMRLPGTGLDLTNGSLSIHHASDGRYAKGVHVSVQLTY